MNTPSLDTAAIIAAASTSALGQREVVNLLVAALEVLSQRVAELEARPVGDMDMTAKIEAAVENAVENLDLDDRMNEFMRNYDLSDNWNFENEVQNVIDNADIDSKIERALEGADLSDAVETALRDGAHSDAISAMVDSAIEELDAAALVRRGMQSILLHSEA